MEAMASFLIAALALTGSPGPNTLSLAAVGASFGRVRGIEYLIGLTLGMVGVIAIVGTGVAGVIFALPGIAPVVSALAAAYFLYLAYRIATAPPLAKTDASRPGSVPRWYEGTFLSLVNPKAYAAVAALFSGHVLAAGNALTDGLWKAGLLLITLGFVNVVWLCVGAGMTRFLRNERTARLVNVCFAALLLVSVAFATLG